MKKIISFAHIAKSLSILHIMLFYLISTKAQTPSVIQKVNVFGHYSRHTITKLNFLRPDKYNIAVDYQLGVIGNDFWGEQKLPNNYNDNSFEKTLTSTNYHAVNGYKGTLSGKLVMHGFRREGGKDDDLKFTIVCNPKTSIGASNYLKIKNRSYNDYPYPYVEGEIDIQGGFQKFFEPTNINYGVPTKYSTDICLYGPWVQELYDSREDPSGKASHLDVHEIHPAEQFWWAEKIQTGFRYYLNAANDASGRFAESGWASNETTHTFAIAFDIRKPGNVKEKQIFNIEKICSWQAGAQINDTKKHYLVLGNDTLIEVIEPIGDELLSISFVDVGIDPFSITPKQDTLIKGFVVIQSKIYKEGNIKLKVDKKSILNKVVFQPVELNQKGKNQEDVKTHSIRISLKEITTLENKFSTGFGFSIKKRFKLRGYILAEKETAISSFSKSTSQILEGRPLLLFPLNGPDYPNRYILHNGNNRTDTYTNSGVILKVKDNEAINILTDFVASYETKEFIRTLELIEGAPYYELKILPNSLIKGQTLVKEIILHNKKGPQDEDPKEYKMKIKIEFLLLD